MSSNVCAFFISTPTEAPRPTATMIDIGVANPNAYDLYSLGKDGKAGGDGEDMDLTSWNGAVRQLV